MSRYHWWTSLLLVVGCWGFAPTASSQAILLYSPDLNSDKLESQGIEIAQEAIQLLRFQRPDAALARAKLSTQLAPEIYQTWFILGTLYLQQQELDSGIAALKTAQALAPQEAGILFSLGNAYFQKGDYPSAITHLQAGLQLEPQSAVALFDLGNAYFKMQQYEDSLKSYRRAIAVDAKFWPAINNIGLIDYERGDVPGAMQKWREVIAIDAQQPEPQLALAVALYKQGKTKEGLALGEAALTLDGRYGELKFLEENLWGAKLLADTQVFFQTPAIREVLLRTTSTAGDGL